MKPRSPDGLVLDKPGEPDTLIAALELVGSAKSRFHPEVKVSADGLASWLRTVAAVAKATAESTGVSVVVSIPGDRAIEFVTGTLDHAANHHDDEQVRRDSRDMVTDYLESMASGDVHQSYNPSE